MKYPLVSVIVPIYNVESYLKRCLDGILNQCYSNLEIILVNDGSTDQSESIIQSYLVKDQRIRYISQINSGPSIARNKGITEATGEFICFIDADDFVPNNYIQLLIEKVSKGYDIVACGYIEVSDYGRVELNDFYRSKDLLTRNEFIDGVLRGVGGTLWAKIYRRNLIESHKLYLNPDVYMCEDLLFNLEYCRYAQQFATIKPSLYEYNRLNEGSITSKIMLKDFENNLLVMEEMNQLLQVLGYSHQKIEVLSKQRMTPLILSIASNESAQLMNVGMKYCSNQLEVLTNHPFVQKYLVDYHPKKKLLDCGGYYLKRRHLKHAVIAFFMTLQLRRFKLWIRKRGRV